MLFEPVFSCLLSSEFMNNCFVSLCSKQLKNRWYQVLSYSFLDSLSNMYMAFHFTPYSHCIFNHHILQLLCCIKHRKKYCSKSLINLIVYTDTDRNQNARTLVWKILEKDGRNPISSRNVLIQNNAVGTIALERLWHVQYW